MDWFLYDNGLRLERVKANFLVNTWFGIRQELILSNCTSVLELKFRNNNNNNTNNKHIQERKPENSEVLLRTVARSITPKFTSQIRARSLVVTKTLSIFPHLAFTCSMLTIEILEQDVKYVQS